MNLLATRTRLLSGAALTVGLTMIAASPAQAACTNVGNGIECLTNTTTTDTTSPANVPNDRNYPFNSPFPIHLDVGSGVLVDGFGLAMTDIGPGNDVLTVTNLGTIQVNAGNTPTAGGLDGASARHRPFRP